MKRLRLAERFVKPLGEISLFRCHFREHYSLFQHAVTCLNGL